MHRSTRFGLLLAAVVVALSCRGEDDAEDLDGDERQAGGGGLVTESDSTACGVREPIYENLSKTTVRMHVRLSNGCHENPQDTLPPGPAVISVLDSNDRLFDRQSFSARDRRWKRVTVTVPGRGKLMIDCGAPRNLGHCYWSYSYSP